MTRKLFSLLLSSFAVVLLMGAGVEQESAALVEEPVVQTAQEETTVQPEAVLLPEEETPTVEETLDDTLTVDGQPVSKDTAKTLRNGTTYVALVPMAQSLDSTVMFQWNADTRTAVVNNDKLVLTAKVGDLYVVVNNRYLYVPEKVQLVDGHVTLPLSVVAEAFDASLTWDSATGNIAITRGSGGATFGELYYNAEDLFWLSRVIYTESGNQPLEGKMAVGNVVLNRTKHPSFPDTIEGVLAQKNQFTTYWTGHIGNSTPNAESVIAAKLVLDGGVVEEVKDALYFDSAVNSWASRNRTCVAVIGGHRFYA